MNRLFSVLILAAIAFVCLGFYRGWFHIGSENTGDKTNVTFSVDREKLHEDEKKAAAEVRDVERQVKNKVARPSDKTMDGTVVSVTADKLTMSNKEGKEHSHALAADVKVTCDGKACATTDLKAGMRIRVTTNHAEPHAATRIEAIDNNPSFEKGA